MKKAAFALYRKWTHDIFSNIINDPLSHDEIDVPLLITTPEAEFDLVSTDGVETIVMEGKDQVKLAEVLKKHDIDTIFFYGWSWIVKEPIVSDYTCVCLHPSPLPLYRGGSPIQHQIIAGETQSAVSIIKMSAGIDDGDIYTQIPFDLSGYLPEIFDRIIEAGTNGTKAYLKDMKEGEVTFTPQADLEKHPPLKRRTPDQSTLTVESLAKMRYEELYNLVRGLQLPYPQVNIKSDMGNLEIETVEFLITPQVGLTIYDGQLVDSLKFPLLLKLADGFALVTKGNFRK